MSFVQKYKDVIGELLMRQLQSYIAQDILEHLDAGSLNNAEQVCQQWREAISDADLWQKLYNKNMKLDSRSAWKMMHSILLKRQTLSPEAPKHEKKEEEEQDEHFWLKTQCLIVNKFLQDLEQNWKTGPIFYWRSPMERKVRRLEADKHCFIRSPEPIAPFQMDNLRICRWVTKKTRHERPDRNPEHWDQLFFYHQQHHLQIHFHHNQNIAVGGGGRGREDVTEIRGCFYIFNRWTLKLETATQWEHENPYKCHDISGDLLAAGYYNNGTVNVWDVSAKKKQSQKIHAFNEVPNWPIVDVNQGGVHNEPVSAWSFSSGLVKFCPKAQYLASVLTGKKRMGEEVTIKHLLTLREFKSVSEVTVKHRLLLEDVDETRELYVDDRYVVLLYNRLEPADEGGDARILMGMVDIRSTSTFELVHSLPVGKDLNYSFHYLNGLFLTSCPAGLLKVWEVNTGLCIATISDLTLSSSPFRLVSDKYIVGFSRSEWTDGLKVWDLRALIRAGSVTDGPGSGSCALWTLPISTDREWRHLIVDEYQVYAYGRFTYPDEFGGRDYFMFALDLLDNLQDSDRRFQLQRLYQ